MSIEPYAINGTFSTTALQRRTPINFRGKSRTLGELFPVDMDYGQLLSQLPQTIMALYQAGRTADVQQQLIDLNIQRSQQGKGPITLDMIGGAALAQPGVTVSMSPETKQALTIGALGLGAAFLLSRRKRR